ncbi:ribosomal protein S18-alanine N-acetyltransferase [Desulfosediminicola flagellatus]|uniref:ribosomal protein S18-alanine N-acetyltransferase n=1 Tax=Desulfosediminicola flagellatus TaxID=2569541 RepID=UPI0010AD5FAC|nr:ribosomal protein S18-alanine N-acetyltransferase [Desulfosediminicola flagellatus]
MIIREMGLGDLPHISQIEQDYPSPWALAQLSSELTYADGISLVAEDESGIIIGWCSARFAAPEAELLKIAVHHDRRGEGIAGLLLGHLLDALSHKNVETLFLEVRSQNRSALRFYRNHGFIQVGERPGYYADPKDNALIFSKELLIADR